MSVPTPRPKQCRLRVSSLLWRSIGKECATVDEMISQREKFKGAGVPLENTRTQRWRYIGSCRNTGVCPARSRATKKKNFRPQTLAREARRGTCFDDARMRRTRFAARSIDRTLAWTNCTRLSIRRIGFTMSLGFRSPDATSCSIGVNSRKFSQLTNVTSPSARRVRCLLGR